MAVEIFADGANLEEMIRLYNDPMIAGLTTNPTLMRKAGITDYKVFALKVLQIIKAKPISFEVFADDFDEMWGQAREISSWGRNVYVKIPITDTQGVYNYTLIERLSSQGVKLNITAITTNKQVFDILPSLYLTKGAYISIFAGRIADTGVDPIPVMKLALKLINNFGNDNIELIWASPREVLNVVQANEIGCHIITCTSDILKKLPLLGKDLTEYSLETVKMFVRDGEGFTI